MKTSLICRFLQLGWRNIARSYSLMASVLGRTLALPSHFVAAWALAALYLQFTAALQCKALIVVLLIDCGSRRDFPKRLRFVQVRTPHSQLTFA